MNGVIIPTNPNDTNKEDKVNKIDSWETINPDNYPTAYLVNESIKDLQDQIDDIWVPRTHVLRYTANANLQARTEWQGHQRDGAHFQNPTFIFQNFNPNNVAGSFYDWRAFKDIIPFNCRITSAWVTFCSGSTISIDFALYSANLPQGTNIGVPEQGTNRKVNIRETLSLTQSNSYCFKKINPANISSDILHEGAFWTPLFNNGNVATNLFSFTLCIAIEEVKL